MDIEEPFKMGFLFMPPQSFLRKTWIKRFCVLYKASNHGIQRLEIFENDDAFLKQSKSPSKLVLLTDCVKATAAPQKQQANVFEVRTKTSSYLFSADSFNEMTEWLTALQCVAFGASRPPSNVLPSVKEVKHEENMLYSSVNEPEVYIVTALDTEAMSRNNLKGDYKLIVTSISISLADNDNHNRIGEIFLTWLYRHIRRYGCGKNTFSFEAGRKCVSGEGLFSFGTKDGTLIFQNVDAHVSSLKLLQSDVTVPSSPPSDDEKITNTFFSKGMSTFNENFQKDISVNYINTNVCSNEHKTMPDKGVTLKSNKNVQKPLSKPPRKSKLNSQKNAKAQKVDNFKATTSLLFHSNESCLLNNYDELKNTAEKDEFKSQDFRTKADFDLKSEALYKQEVLEHDADEPVYALLEENSEPKSDLSCVADKLNEFCVSAENNLSEITKNSENDIFAKHIFDVSDSSNYDHLSLRKLRDSRTDIQSHAEDHVYGKLVTSRPPSVTVNPRNNTYGSIHPLKRHTREVDCNIDGDHHYTNIKLSQRFSISNESDSNYTEKKLTHFVQNNAEYAQVCKNNKM